MTRYSQAKSVPDEETPSLVDDLELPADPKIGDEYWVDSFQSLVIWTGTNWQRTYTPPVIAQPGQAEFSGTSTWIVPDGITNCSILCVGSGGRGGRNSGNTRWYGGGGGALAYVNNVSLTPGETLTINFESETNRNPSASVLRDTTVLCKAQGAGRLSPAYGSPGSSGSSIGDVKYSGAAGGFITPPAGPYGAGGYSGPDLCPGGAAAGYSGNGDTTGQPQSGISGYYVNNTQFHGGGGIGIKGTSVGSTSISDASGAYGGTNGSQLNGGSYGGGAALRLRENPSTTAFPDGTTSGTPGGARVRIIYGDDRSYPANAEDV